MLFQIVISNQRGDGFNTFNIEEEIDLFLCPPETAVGRALEEIAFPNLRFEVVESEVPTVGQRRIDARLYLAGRTSQATHVSLEVSSPSSNDNPQKWAFLGQKRKKVLIVCSGNSCRSQMAEGFLKDRFADSIEVHSAGLTPARQVNPNAIAVMSDVRIDISGHRPKPIQSFKGQEFDYVISVCDVNAENMPYISKSSVALDYGIVDPVAYEGVLPEEELITEFQTAREEIFDVLDQFAAHIANQLSFVSSRAERKRAAQRIFKSTRDRQLVTQSQLNKVIKNPMSGVEVIEACASDVKLSLIEHIEEPQKHFPVRVGFGVALAITLLTSTPTVEFLPSDISQRASDYLDVIGWSVAATAIAWGLSSWWQERAKLTKSDIVDAILNDLQPDFPNDQKVPVGANKTNAKGSKAKDAA